MNNIIRNYININYKLFITFGIKFIDIKDRLNGGSFNKSELNNIKLIKDTFKANSPYLRHNMIDYDKMIFICFNSNRVGYDYIIFPLPMSIEYFNSIIKPKFDKYIKLQVFA